MCGTHGSLYSRPSCPVPRRVASRHAASTGIRASGGDAASMIARGWYRTRPSVTVIGGVAARRFRARHFKRRHLAMAIRDLIDPPLRYPHGTSQADLANGPVTQYKAQNFGDIAHLQCP